MIKLKIFKAEFTESKVAFKKVAFLGKWLKPLFSTCKRIALMASLNSYDVYIYAQCIKMGVLVLQKRW